MTANRLRHTASWILLVLCTGVLTYRLGLRDARPERPEGPNHYYRALARALAGEALKQVEAGSPAVVFMYASMEAVKGPSPTDEVRRSLASTGLQLKALVELDLPEQHPEEAQGFVPFPAETFMQALEAHPACPVFISLVGEPALNQEQEDRLRERDPVLVVLSEGGSSDWNTVQRMIRAGLIDAAVVRNLKPENWDRNWEHEERAWFERRYEVVQGGTAAP